MGSYKQIDHDRIIRAIALSNLMSMYVNSYVGSLTSVCGCSLAAGIGAAAGITFLLGGDVDAVERAAKNMAGSIVGIICDGSKLGCAWKLGLSVDWSIKSALMALNECCIHQGGILEDSLEQGPDNPCAGNEGYESLLYRRRNGPFFIEQLRRR